MQIINHIHTKQEKFKYIILNDYTFQGLFIQKPLSSIYTYETNMNFSLKFLKSYKIHLQTQDESYIYLYIPILYHIKLRKNW